MNEILIYVIIAGVIGVLALLWFKGKKKWVLQTIYTLMVTAEGLLGSDAGQAKLDIVMDSYSKKVERLPFLPRWIIEKFFPAERLEAYINKFLPAINDMFREKYSLEENFIDSIIEKSAKAGKNFILNKALNADFNGDGELVDDVTLIDISDETDIMVEKEKRGFVKGYAELNTDFKKAQLKAGVQAAYTF